MPLQTLKPRLAASGASRVATLQAKAGATKRDRGRSWGVTRHRIAKAHNYTCAGCGLLWRPGIDHIDHITPLGQGGSNGDSNLQPLCRPCHDAKTAREARIRAKGGG